MTTSEFKSYPPVSDTVSWIKDVDWQDAIYRLRSGVANVLLWAIAFSEKSYDFHEWLYQQVDPTPSAEPEDVPLIPIPDLDGLSIWHTPAAPAEVTDDLGRVF